MFRIRVLTPGIVLRGPGSPLSPVLGITLQAPPVPLPPPHLPFPLPLFPAPLLFLLPSLPAQLLVFESLLCGKQFADVASAHLTPALRRGVLSHSRVNGPAERGGMPQLQGGGSTAQTWASLAPDPPAPELPPLAGRI